MPVFGQFVLGPPGSGKTTYCGATAKLLAAMGRQVAVVNIDPANCGSLPYKAAVDLRELVTIEDVMQELKLGPNGAMVYCVEFLEKNFEHFLSLLRPFMKDGYYFLIDCPGQVELYTHHNSVRNILRLLEREQFRLCAVNLIDCYHVCEIQRFVSVLLLCASMQLHLELPHVNVLSKADLLDRFDSPPFGLEFYTDGPDMERVAQQLREQASDPSTRSASVQHLRLTAALAELVDENVPASFQPLNVFNSESVARLLRILDRANGYAFGPDGAAVDAAALVQSLGLDALPQE